MNSNLESKMKEAAHTIVTRVACLRRGLKTLVICGKHNAAFAQLLMDECYEKRALPHLWTWDEQPLPNNQKAAAKDVEVEVPKCALSLLISSDVVIWLTQFEDPVKAKEDLRAAVCSFWDRV